MVSLTSFVSYCADLVKSTAGNKDSDSLPSAPEVNTPRVQSQMIPTEDSLDPFNQTDNQLAQRSSSITSDDVLLGNQVFESKISLRDNSTSEDQEVLLELNTEEQEQFEVLDSADGEDDKSQGAIISNSVRMCDLISSNYYVDGNESFDKSEDVTGHTNSDDLSPSSATSSDGNIQCLAIT